LSGVVTTALSEERSNSILILFRPPAMLCHRTHPFLRSAV
jgi:hypothetical protein